MFIPPVEVEAVTAAFASLFTPPSWRRAQALLCGVLLAPANHALTAALRALGMADDARFQNYPRLLNRVRWSARAAAGVLLRLLVATFAPTGPLILGLDETVERRRGPQIKARALYRDAARSSRECFQKTSGLRWLSLHLLVPVRWARRVWALPFLTALCPSARYAPYVARGRRQEVACPTGAWTHRPGGALAAGPRAHRGGRQRLCGHRVAGVVSALARAGDADHAPAPGCRPLERIPFD